MRTREAFSVFSKISKPRLRALLTAALDEDVGTGDLTTEALVPRDLQASAYLLIKQEGVLAGTEVLCEVFSLLDDTFQAEVSLRDGHRVSPGDVPVRMTGLASHLLTGERTALNFTQKLSGVATATSRLVEIAAPHGLRVNHIRKTTPLLRSLEVYAVRVGGGAYNRYGLFDGMLVKDNHLVVAERLGLSVEEVVARCRENAPLTIKVGLEVKELSELAGALRAQPDYIALDNMSTEQIKEAVEQVGGRIPVDVTGGVNAANIKEIAATGANIVGVGGITHSAPSLDMSIEIEFPA